MLRILIIDDEANIRNMISNIISGYCNSAKVIGQAGSVREGIEKIALLDPDLVLLDVKMGDGTGFDLLEKIKKISFKTIFITAYQEFAIKAIKFSALDYILKPVDPDELIRAIDNAAKTMEESQIAQLEYMRHNMVVQNIQDKKIMLKTTESMYVVPVQNICCCVADGGYTRFHTGDGKKILVSKPLSEYEDLFSDCNFFRVHKSYLVNLHKIQCFRKIDGGYLLMEGEIKVPVASRKREQLLELLERFTE